MGIVIRISAYGEWVRTYFVQTLDEEEAKEKAFRMFKGYMSCWLPDTLEEAEMDDGFWVEVLDTVEQIIL